MTHLLSSYLWLSVLLSMHVWMFPINPCLAVLTVSHWPGKPSTTFKISAKMGNYLFWAFPMSRWGNDAPVDLKSECRNGWSNRSNQGTAFASPAEKCCRFYTHENRLWKAIVTYVVYPFWGFLHICCSCHLFLADLVLCSSRPVSLIISLAGKETLDGEGTGSSRSWGGLEQSWMSDSVLFRLKTNRQLKVSVIALQGNPFIKYEISWAFSVLL